LLNSFFTPEHDYHCLFLYQVAVLRGFQTFDDKSSAFDPVTGVHEKLKNMILNCRRPGQKLAVGKLEYKAIIQVTLVSPTPRLYSWRSSPFAYIHGQRSSFAYIHGQLPFAYIHGQL
jgi:hypothetical protein